MPLLLSKADPLFRSDLRLAPAKPLGSRCFILPKPVTKTTEGGLVKPETAMERTFAGILLQAGDQAADKLYDLDCRIGDEVWYGKFAGVIEEWQRIVKDGEGKACEHDSVWEIVPRDDKRWSAVKGHDIDMELRSCRMCGALKLAQRVVIIDAEDLVCSVDAQARMERGETRRVRDKDADGRTRYVIEGLVDTFETKGAK